MIIAKYKSEITGFEAHVCMIRMNADIYFTVDIFDVKEKCFLPLVKTFKPTEKARALEFAKDCISA